MRGHFTLDIDQSPSVSRYEVRRLPTRPFRSSTTLGDACSATPRLPPKFLTLIPGCASSFARERKNQPNRGAGDTYPSPSRARRDGRARRRHLDARRDSIRLQTLRPSRARAANVLVADVRADAAIFVSERRRCFEFHPTGYARAAAAHRHASPVASRWTSGLLFNRDASSRAVTLRRARLGNAHNVRKGTNPFGSICARRNASRDRLSAENQ